MEPLVRIELTSTVYDTAALPLSYRGVLEQNLRFFSNAFPYDVSQGVRIRFHTLATIRNYFITGL